MIYVFNSQAWLTAMICSTSSAICGAPNCPCRPLISSSARTSSCRCWPISPRPGAPHLHIKLFFFFLEPIVRTITRNLWNGLTTFDLSCASYDDTNLVFVAFQPMSRSLTVSFSVPTPRITDSITTAWAPLSPGKSRVLRIGSTLALDAEYRPDVSRFWNEEVPALLSASKKSASQASSPIKEEL